MTGYFVWHSQVHSLELHFLWFTMAECLVCGEKDFQCVEGHFYCTLCHTQSQDIREVDDEMDIYEGSAPVHLKYVQISNRKRCSLPTKEARKECEPLSLYEAFTIILRNQVESLIKFGAPPELKQVVFNLLAAYLCKCDVAFHGTDKEFVPPTPAELRKKANRRRGCKSRGKKVATEKLNKEFLKSVFEEDFYDEDAPWEDSDQEANVGEVPGFADVEVTNESSTQAAPHNSKSGETSDESEAQWQSQSGEYLEKKSDYQNSPKMRLRIRHTLCFLYLGLMYVKFPLLLSDVLRLILQKRLPYFTAVGLLKDYDMFKEDVLYLSVRLQPKMELIIRESKGLFSYLELHKCPYPRPNVMSIVARFATELNLPAELLALLKNLANVLPDYLVKKISNWEAFAMSIIIVVLKMLFGFNDNTEKMLSEYARNLNATHAGSGAKSFVLDEWTQQVEERLHRMRYYLPGMGLENVSVDRDNMTATINAFNNLRAGVVNPANKIWKAKRKSKDVSMLNPFMHVLKEDSLQEMVPDPTFMLPPIKKHCDNAASETDADFSNSSLHFVTSKVKHAPYFGKDEKSNKLCQGKTFVVACCKKNGSCFRRRSIQRIQTSYARSQKKQSSSSVKKAPKHKSQKLSPSPVSPQKKIKRTKEHSAMLTMETGKCSSQDSFDMGDFDKQGGIGDSDADELDSNDTSDTDATSASTEEQLKRSIWQVKVSQPSSSLAKNTKKAELLACSHYTCYKRFSKKGIVSELKLHNSFHWLLSVLSQCIGCTMNTLFRHVEMTELSIIWPQDTVMDGVQFGLCVYLQHSALRSKR